MKWPRPLVHVIDWFLDAYRGLPKPPRTMVTVIVFLVVLSWLPLAWIARHRAMPSEQPRIHIFQDMDEQPKYEPQEPSPLFADGRAMRPRVPGTVARGELRADDHMYRGKVDGEWAETFPLPVDRALLERGRQQYNIHCAVCHGYDGSGNGPIQKRVESLDDNATAGWVAPWPLAGEASLAQQVEGRADGHIFNTITNGLRNMPAYGTQIEVKDRWAIVAYVRALQVSQSIEVEKLPASLERQLPASGQ